jgi:Protein of unknown function (DUF2442)
MSISNKIQNKRSADPFDILIFEKGLRIKNVVIDKELDLMLVVLSNGFVIKEMLADYPSLKKATIKNLNSWRLISGGIGISWGKINEDLSLKGFLKNGAINETLRLLNGKGTLRKIIA